MLSVARENVADLALRVARRSETPERALTRGVWACENQNLPQHALALEYVRREKIFRTLATLAVLLEGLTDDPYYLILALAWCDQGGLYDLPRELLELYGR